MYGHCCVDIHDVDVVCMCCVVSIVGRRADVVGYAVSYIGMLMSCVACCWC